MLDTQSLAKKILDRASPRIPDGFGLSRTEKDRIFQMVRGYVETEISRLSPDDETSQFVFAKESLMKLRSAIKTKMFADNPAKQAEALKLFNSTIKDWENYIQCSDLIKKIQVSASDLAQELKAPQERPF